jgi:predicted nucleic acid-binding protein
VAAYFVDSSALVKRYVQEVGTRRVRDLTRRNTPNNIDPARITAVEVTSAVARRRRGRTITPPRASSILYRFREHLSGRYLIIEITPALLNDATRLANTHDLRAHDAVQLAVPLDLSRRNQDAGFGPIALVSADQALNDAARAEGLAVDDPNTHP